MTGIRQSIVFSKEAEGGYGQGKADGAAWIAPPPGSFFTSTHNRNVQRIQTTGSKFWDTQAYGQLSGSWTWTFTMDYEYLEPFFFVFEKITAGNISTQPMFKDAPDGPSSTSPPAKFKFEKINNDRIPSFTVLRKINNQMVGGDRNEITQLTGCVVKSFQIQRSAATSKIDVSLSGFYSNERLMAADAVPGTIWPTDYQEYDNKTGGLIEYSCLYAGTLVDGEYMANTESISIGMDNSAVAVYSVCSPFASNYYEGLTSITFNTVCYSTDPLQYKTRLYSGGFTNRPPDGNGTSPYAPMSKGMKPVPVMSIACYSNQINRDDPTYEPGAQDGLPYNDVTTTDTSTEPPTVTVDHEGSVAEAFRNSDRFVGFQLDQVVVKSMPWQKGDGSKLQDSLSGSEVRKLTVYVKSIGPHNSGGTTLGVDNWFTSSNEHSVNVLNPDLVDPVEFTDLNPGKAGNQDQLF